MRLAVCLCGTPQASNIGGIRGGRTPNLEAFRLTESLQWAQQILDGTSILKIAEKELVGKERLVALLGRLKEGPCAIW